MKLITICKNSLFERRISTILIFFLVAVVISSLILLFAINEAGNREIVTAIKKGGNLDLVKLEKGVFTEKGFRGKIKAVLSFCDLRLIKNRCPYVKEITFDSSTGIDEIWIGNKQYNIMADAVGVSPEYLTVMDIKIKEGRFINRMDLRYKRRVCVLGGEVARVMGQKNLIGKKLITKNPDAEFTIIGILHKKMPLFTVLPEDIAFRLPMEINAQAGRKSKAFMENSGIYIPFTTWQDFNKGKTISNVGIYFESKTYDDILYSPSTLPKETNAVWIKTNTSFKGNGKEKFIKEKEDLRAFKEFCFPIPEGLKAPLDSIRKILRKKYGEDAFFYFLYYGSLVDELNDQMDDSKKLMSIIFLFSLLLSGIILSSMMLLSVHKRINEIGVRRAFGATKKDIFLQFLSEGAVIYSIGIIIGLLVGIVISYFVVSKILSWEFSIPVYGIIISSIFVFLVGIVAGLYPAMKASNIPPAEAVKYE